MPDLPTAFSKDEKSWRSEDSFDVRHGDIRHVDAKFRVYSAGFCSCFGLVFSHCTPLFPFWNGIVYSVPLYVGSM